MEFLQTISKMALAGLAVWRLTRAVHEAFDDRGAAGSSQPVGAVRGRTEGILGSRVMDFLYWIGIWMSAQTALWVACGLGGVLLNWLAFSAIARVARWLKAKAIVPATEHCDRSAQLCL